MERGRSTARRVGVSTSGRAPDEDDVARYIADVAGNVSVWTVPDARHIQGLAVAPDE